MAFMRPGRKEQHRACERETNADSGVFPRSRDGLGFLVFNLLQPGWNYCYRKGLYSKSTISQAASFWFNHILIFSCSFSMKIIPVPARRSCTSLFSLSMMAHWITGMRFFLVFHRCLFMVANYENVIEFFLEAHATLPICPIFHLQMHISSVSLYFLIIHNSCKTFLDWSNIIGRTRKSTSRIQQQKELNHISNLLIILEINVGDYLFCAAFVL